MRRLSTGDSKSVPIFSKLARFQKRNQLTTMVDPTSIGTAVLSTFHVLYLTVRFIYREVLRAKGFHDGRARMAQMYRLEIVRLRAFWTDILGLIYTTLSDMSTALNTYSRFARELDEDYQKYVVRSSLLVDAASAKIELPLDLDDETDDLTAEELEAEKSEPDRPDAIVKQKPSGLFNLFGGRGDTNKQEKVKSVILPVKWKELPQGIAWCFQERHLNKSLRILKDKNDTLNTLSPCLVISLDRSSTIGRQVETGRAYKDYRGHMLLQQKAKDYASGRPGAGAAPISWQTMKGYIEDSRQPLSKILVERKETGNFPRSSMAAAAVKERKEEEEYAPQLASLLLSSSRDFFEGNTLGTLPFKGFSKDTTVPNGCFSFAFDYPEGAVGHKPLSVQHLICSGQDDHKLSLNDRFQMARMVSQCLATLHSDGWLHKSIRSHAIKFFFRKTDKDVVLETSAPYLTDFGFSRPLGAFSAVQYAASTAVNLDMDIYRHPRRFGEPSQFFNMIHDVYSLGVVLLEIGLWKTARQMYNEIFQSAKDKPTGEDVQKAFIKRAQQELEHSMGSAYRDAVLLCLDGEQLKKHLNKPSFAIEFQKNVVRKVDVAFLNREGTDFDNEAEPPRYEDIVSSSD
ncbi:hypothetical protein HD806DRAFT_527702 [Xylariaceae sp. AK1471]|nr:hypothetical protein HD806DRAFT_527702 [Xylariaceae sp. AK1471]